MGVILAIIALVALVTLYDYFSARTWQQVTSDTRNDMVFEGRNREYGAYVLRTEYDKRLMLIMFSLLAVIGLSYGTYIVIKNLPEEKLPPPPVDTSQFTVQAPPVEEDVPPPPPEEPPPPMEKTVAFTPPVVVDIPVEDQIPIQEDMEDTKADTKTNETDNVSWEAPVNGPAETKEVEEKEPEIYTYVDEDPEFPGGYAAMMAFIQKNFNYPQVAIENNIQGKCYVKFVVKGDGTVSSVQVERGIAGCPECDKEAVRVVRMMPGWRAGKVNGKSVSTLYRLPINFALE
ncbi:MAG: energy transducer TonB [Flavobacteriia bacterium]|jgi:protein TonB